MMEKEKQKKQLLFNEDLHFEHKQWLSELNFWEDELRSFNNRLDELVQRWTDRQVLVQLEHYQNEFILQNGIIDHLKEDIEIHETRIAAQTKSDKQVLDTKLTKRHLEFRGRMETQRHIYAELKKEFFRFLSKYL